MRRAPVIHLKHDYASPVVVSDFVYSGEDRRTYMIAADIYELFFDLFRIIEPFDAPLIVNAENYRASSGVCKRDDLAANLLGVHKANLELNMSVFSAANEAEQVSSIERARISSG